MIFDLSMRQQLVTQTPLAFQQNLEARAMIDSFLDIPALTGRAKPFPCPIAKAQGTIFRRQPNSFRAINKTICVGG